MTYTCEVTVRASIHSSPCICQVIAHAVSMLQQVTVSALHYQLKRKQERLQSL